MDKSRIDGINDTRSSVFKLVALQEISVNNEGMFGDNASSPEVRRVVFVSSLNGSKGSLDKVSSSSG